MPYLGISVNKFFSCCSQPQPVKLITGLIAPSEEIFSRTEKTLQRVFGPIDYRSQTIKFDVTDHYRKDMGPDLKRRFVSFKRLIKPAALSGIKLITNRVERRLSKEANPAPLEKDFLTGHVRNIASRGGNEISNGARGSKRAVNIDPGYITEAKLVLASTKDYAHRIYLDKGICAEVTLYYKDGTFRWRDWTYMDYRTDDYIRIFNHIRNIYRQDKA